MFMYGMIFSTQSTSLLFPILLSFSDSAASAQCPTCPFRHLTSAPPGRGAGSKELWRGQLGVGGSAAGTALTPPARASVNASPSPPTGASADDVAGGKARREGCAAVCRLS